MNDGLGLQFLGLEERRHNLDELNKEAARQLTEIASFTNQVALARAVLQKEFEQKNLLINESQTNRLAELARISESMMNDSPENALRALKLNQPDQVARIMYFMAETNRASVFNNLAQDDTEPGTSLLREIQDAYKKIIIDDNTTQTLTTTAP